MPLLLALGSSCSQSLFDDNSNSFDGGLRPGEDGSLAADADPLAPDADPFAPDANPLACSSIPTAQIGANLGTISAGDSNILHGSCGNGLPNEDAPEALYKLTLAEPGDIRLSVTGTTGSPDVIVYIVSDCAAGASELICADNPDELELRDAAAGTYYIVVEGYSADDLGGYRLDVETVDIVSLGDACGPSLPGVRCESTQLCDTTCKAATSLLDIDFTTSLSPAQVTDIGSDGITWKFCSSAGACFYNQTGSSSGGGSAIVEAAAFSATDGEVLATPTVDATAYSKVVLSFDQYFYKWFACNDAGFIEIKSGATTSRIDTLLEVHKGHAEYDISAQAAGKSFSAQFVYDDETVGSDCNAQSWQIDDIIVRAL